MQRPPTAFSSAIANSDNAMYSEKLQCRSLYNQAHGKRRTPARGAVAKAASPLFKVGFGSSLTSTEGTGTIQVPSPCSSA